LSIVSREEILKIRALYSHPIVLKGENIDLARSTLFLNILTVAVSSIKNLAVPAALTAL
jgi:hypothetical protein